MPNWPFYRLAVKIQRHLHANQSTGFLLPSSLLLHLPSPPPRTLLRLAAVVVEHLVQRGKDGGRLLMPEPAKLVMGAGHQLRRAQPVVADAVLAAHALAAAAHQPAGALAVHDDAGKVLAALVADAAQAGQLAARVQFGTVGALARVLDAGTGVQLAADLQDVGGLRKTPVNVSSEHDG
uniref:(northern house mosquito) hypothetical protein n=1 Tax=Culex pipiens TaxID=7175 RepID=A0A8D8DRJ4_CULPI